MKGAKVEQQLCPANTNKLKYLYTGRIPKSELGQHLLIRNVNLNAQGILDTESAKLASLLDIPHQVGAATEAEFPNKRKYIEHLQDLKNDRTKKSKTRN